MILSQEIRNDDFFSDSILPVEKRRNPALYPPRIRGKHHAANKNPLQSIISITAGDSQRIKYLMLYLQAAIGSWNATICSASSLDGTEGEYL